MRSIVRRVELALDKLSLAEEQHQRWLRTTATSLGLIPPSPSDCSRPFSFAAASFALSNHTNNLTEVHLTARPAFNFGAIGMIAHLAEKWDTHVQSIGDSVLGSTHTHLTRRHEWGSICFLVFRVADNLNLDGSSVFRKTSSTQETSRQKGMRGSGHKVLRQDSNWIRCLTGTARSQFSKPKGHLLPISRTNTLPSSFSS